MNTVEEYLTNPDRFVYSFDIDEGDKVRSILTYNRDRNTGKTLRAFHEKLIREFTDNFADRNEHSFAYHKHVRCLDAIEDHKRSDFFIKLDIHHFFESISYDLFIKTYRDVFNNNWKDKLQYFFYKGHLSIGFVSSPAISDFFMSKFDRAVSAYLAKRPGLHYSRYSDDILLSSEGDTEDSLNQLFAFVESELKKLSLTLNAKKTRRVHLDLAKKNAITFLGLNLSKADEHNNKVTISKRYILFLLFLMEKDERYGGKCRELVQEINSRVAYLAYNSPISFARFQKKYLARFGKEYDFKPKEARTGTVLETEKMPDILSEVNEDFQISMNQTVADPKTGRVVVRNGITLEAYLGSNRVVEIPKIVNHIGSYAFQNSCVEKVILHQGVKSIGEGAFSYSEIQEIELPKSVVYLGKGAFESTTRLKRVHIPANLQAIPERCFLNSALETVTFADRPKLRRIELCAFSRTGIKDIRLPDSVDTVEGSAFSDCADLTGYTLSKNLTEIPGNAFSGCIRLKEAHIPDSVLTVSDSAFGRCTSLRTVTIGRSLVNFGKDVFSGDTEIQTVRIDPDNKCFFSNSAASIIEKATRKLVFCGGTPVFDENIEAIGDGLFSGSRIVSLDLTYVKSIGSKAFKDCIHLRKVKFRNTLTRIGRQAFEGCVQLKTIELPDSVTGIGEEAFAGCYNMKKAVLPDCLTRIEKSVFADCTALADVRFPASLESILHNAFRNTKLRTVCIGKNVSYISPLAFYRGGKSLRSIVVDPDNVFFSDGQNGNILLEKKTKTVLLGCKSSKILPGVRSIAPFAFSEVNGLRKLDLPDSVEEIGHHAFLHCFDIQSLVLGKVYTVGSKAFEYCEKLTDVSFSPSLTKIGSDAFHKTSLKKVILPNSLIAIGESAFSDNASLEEIFIPESIRKFSRTWFRNCPGIRTIRISPNHPCFISDPVNAVITKEGKFLFGCGGSVLEGIAIEDYSPFNPNEIRGLKEITLPKGIRHLKTGLFDSCTELEKVTFACGKAQLVPYMFRNCIALKDIDLSGVEFVIPEHAFESCLSLERIHIPDDVQEIGLGAFYGCTGLKDLHLPKSLHRIQKSGFENCSSLERIELSSAFGEMEQGAFKGCSNLKEVVFRNIYGEFVFPGSAFENCISLERVVFLDSDVRITVSQRAFANCPSLKKLDFDAAVCVIQDEAFAGSVNLDFSFGDQLTEIGENAFLDNQVITDVRIGKALKTVSCDSFNKRNLEHISIDPLNQVFSGQDVIIEKRTGKVLVATRNTRLKPDDNASVIGRYAFASLDIASYALPDFITRMEEGAFAGCDNLKSFTFPIHGRFDWVLPDRCFSGCVKLTTLTNHKYMKSINQSVFGNCSSLKKLDFSNAAEIHTLAFSKMKGLKQLRVPAGACGSLVFDSSPADFSTTDGSHEIIAGRKLLVGSHLTVLNGGLSVIGRLAFSNVKGFETLTLPEGLSALDERAFVNCMDIRRVRIPSTLTSIHPQAFENCDNIEEFVVAKNNPCFKALNGHLIAKDDHTLLFAVKNRPVPNQVNDVSPYAFSNCHSASVLYVSSTMAKVPEDLYIAGSYSFSAISVDSKNPLLTGDPDHKSVIRKKDHSLLLQIRDGMIPDGVERLTAHCMVQVPDGVIRISESVKFLHPDFVHPDVSVIRYEVDPCNPFFISNDEEDAVLSRKNSSVIVGTDTSSDMVAHRLQNLYSKRLSSYRLYSPRKPAPGNYVSDTLFDEDDSDEVPF